MLDKVKNLVSGAATGVTEKLTGRGNSRRKAGRKATLTRKRNASKRSASAKRGAATRKANAKKRSGLRRR
jgi:hypothetical protein